MGKWFEYTVTYHCGHVEKFATSNKMLKRDLADYEQRLCEHCENERTETEGDLAGESMRKFFGVGE